MNLIGRAPLLFCAVLLAGCTQHSMEQQVRGRIASIREAILAKRVEGIFEFGTAEWTFVAPDGTKFDRAAYRARTEKLFSSIQIESLDTRIRDIHQHDARADVELTQTMVRVEASPNGEKQRWKVVYDERQDWRKSADRGWLVTRVEVINPRRERLEP